MKFLRSTTTITQVVFLYNSVYFHDVLKNIVEIDF